MKRDLKRDLKHPHTVTMVDPLYYACLQIAETEKKSFSAVVCEALTALVSARLDVETPPAPATKTSQDFVASFAQIALEEPGVAFGKRCFRVQRGTCTNDDATWFSSINEKYYCGACAADLNDRMPGRCVQGKSGHDQRLDDIARAATASAGR